MANVKKGSSFTLVIWLMVAAAVLYLLCWPVLESLWAGYAWDKTPCASYSTRAGYLFNYNGEKYYSNRMDFWERTTINAVRSDTNDLETPVFDQFCYVKHGDPSWAVKNVDALNHLDHATHGAMVAVFVIIAGGILSWASRKFAPKTADAPPIEK